MAKEAAAKLHAELKQRGYKGRTRGDIAKDLEAFAQPAIKKSGKYELAQAFIASFTPVGYPITSTVLPLQLHHERYYRYSGGVWNGVPKAELETMLSRWLQSRGEDVTVSVVKDLMVNIRSLCATLPSSLHMPILIDESDSSRSTTQEILIVDNGVVNVVNRIGSAVVPQLSPHDPRKFSATKLSYDFDPSAECPLWLETLETIFPAISEWRPPH